MAAADTVSVGDVNQDGFDDFILSGAGVRLFHGGSFEQRSTIFAPPGARHFGERVVPMGDLDGDGSLDLAISAPGSGSKSSPPGEVFVYSGAKGEVLYHLRGEANADEFGSGLESPGDFTGDGVNDLVVGAFLCCSININFGRVYLFDGKTGELLRVIDPPAGGIVLGVELDSIGDLNGNGFPDVLAGFENNLDWSAVGIDGGTRAIVRQYDFDSRRILVGGGHDWNDDGFPDFLASVFNLAPGFHIHLISGAPPRTESLGHPCGTVLGQTPRIGATGAPRIGRSYPLHLSEVPPDVPALLRIGTLGKGGLLPVGGARGCTFLGSTLLEIPVKTAKIGPSRGAATVELPIPADPALLDLRFSAQWTVLGSGGRPLAHTRVLRPRIGQ